MSPICSLTTARSGAPRTRTRLCPQGQLHGRAGGETPPPGCVCSQACPGVGLPHRLRPPRRPSLACPCPSRGRQGGCGQCPGATCWDSAHGAQSPAGGHEGPNSIGGLKAWWYLGQPRPDPSCSPLVCGSHGAEWPPATEPQGPANPVLSAFTETSFRRV